MKRRLPKSLLLVACVCLLIRALPVNAQESMVHPVMTFIEGSHAARSLNFIVTSDGNATLALVQGKADDQQVLWHETGPITPAQLDVVQALPRLLGSMIDTYWKGDYAFTFPTPDGKTKSVNLFYGSEHVDASVQDALKQALQTLLDIRKPFEPFIVFGWSGGFAARSTQLVIKADGTASYEDKFKKSTTQGKVNSTNVKTLRKLVQESVASTASVVTSACADCFVYSISVVVDGKLLTIDLDDATLDSAPRSTKDLVALLKNLSAQQATSQVTPTPDPNSPIPSCCSNSVGPGDENDYLGHLNRNDVMIVAARFLALQRNVVATECVVAVLHGPMVYDVALFDGYWIDIEKNATPQAVEAITQSAIDTVAKDCGKDKVKIIRIP